MRQIVIYIITCQIKQQFCYCFLFISQAYIILVVIDLINWQTYFMGCVTAAPHKHQSNINQRTVPTIQLEYKKQFGTDLGTGGKTQILVNQQDQSTQLSNNFKEVAASFSSNEFLDHNANIEKCIAQKLIDAAQTNLLANEHKNHSKANEFVSDDLGLRQTFTGSLDFNQPNKIKIKRYEQGLSIISEASSKQQNSFYTPRGIIQTSILKKIFRNQSKNISQIVSNEEQFYWGPTQQHKINLQIKC